MIEKARDPVSTFEHVVLMERVVNRYARQVESRQTLSPSQIDQIDEGHVPFFEALRIIRRAYPDSRADHMVDLMMHGASLRDAVVATGGMG